MIASSTGRLVYGRGASKRRFYAERKKLHLCVAMHKMCSCSPSLLRDEISGAQARRFAKPLTDPFHRERIGLSPLKEEEIMEVIEAVASPSMGK